MNVGQDIFDSWNAITEQYAVPKTLFKHQVDTIALLLSGENVFCGAPTGSGKTLAQLATVLFTSGNLFTFWYSISSMTLKCQLIYIWRGGLPTWSRVLRLI